MLIIVVIVVVVGRHVPCMHACVMQLPFEYCSCRLIIAVVAMSSYVIYFDFPKNKADANKFLLAIDPASGEILRTVRLASGDVIHRGWKLRGDCGSPVTLSVCAI